MQMRVMGKRLSPCVQHRQEPDFRTEMLGVRSDGSQRLRCCAEQDIVDNGLVLERDDLDLRRHGEHDVEVWHVEQFRLPILQPLRPSQTLALRAVAITTRVERDTLMTAIAATLDMAAERRGTAILDRDHGMPLRGRQRRAMLITESRAEVAEYIRHFQSPADHEPRALGGHQIRQTR